MRCYLAGERVAPQYPGVQFTGLAMVFHGWEMVACEAAGDGAAGESDGTWPMIAADAGTRRTASPILLQRLRIPPPGNRHSASDF